MAPVKIKSFQRVANRMPNLARHAIQWTAVNGRFEGTSDSEITVAQRPVSAATVIESLDLSGRT